MECIICTRIAVCKGLCHYHYAKKRRKLKDHKCCVPKCEEGHHAKGFCYNHYHRFRRTLQRLKAKND